MNLSQRGEPSFEEGINSADQLTLADCSQVLLCLVERLGLDLLCTNHTENGNTDLVLRERS